MVLSKNLIHFKSYHLLSVRYRSNVLHIGWLCLKIVTIALNFVTTGSIKQVTLPGNEQD